MSRRKSLFEETPKQALSFPIPGSKCYPEEYKEQLKAKIAQMEKATAEYNELRAKLQAQNDNLREHVLDESILSMEQLDFLSSLVDFNDYLRFVEEVKLKIKINQESQKFETKICKIQQEKVNSLINKLH